MSAIDRAPIDDLTPPGHAAPGRWQDRLLLLLDRHRKPLLALVALFLLLGFNGQWQIEPDSALYMVLGRNIALRHGYTYHGQPHDLAYPGLPYALAGIFFVSGGWGVQVADAMILLCGLGVLALTYRLVQLAFDRPTAVLITLGVGFSHEFVRYCYEIMTDVPALLGVMAFLAGHEAIFGNKSRAAGHRARWWDWALLVGGLLIAISTRPTSIGLLLAWVIALLWISIRSRQGWRLCLAAAGSVIAGVLLLLWLDPRRASGHSSRQSYERVAIYQFTHDFIPHLHTVVVANLKDLFGLTAARAVYGMPMGTWWLNAILGTVVLVAGLGLIRRQLLWGLWIAINIAMLVFFVSHDRYIVQILPLMVIGWWLTIDAVSRKFTARTGNLIFAGLLLLGMVPNVIQSTNVIVHQHYQPFLSYYKEGRFPPYVSIAKEIRPFTTLQDTVVAANKLARIMTFLSHRNVYEPDEYPDPATVAAGRIFVIYDPADLPFQHWLADRHLVRIGPVLISEPRVGHPAEPLQFWQAGPAAP